MAPRIYLMGACAAIPDLGVGWRRKAADAIREAGGVPVWPPDIHDIADGYTTEEAAREAFTDRSHPHNLLVSRASQVRLDSLCAVATSAAVLLLNDGKDGTGTAAEYAFAVWDAIPIEEAADETDIPRAARAAVEKAKKRETKACPA